MARLLKISARFARAILLAAALFAPFCGGLFAGQPEDASKLVSFGLDGFEVVEIKPLKKGDEIKEGNRRVVCASDMLLVEGRAKAPSEVEIAVALPLGSAWNGMFLGLGNGGMGERLSRAQAVGGANAGYAAAHCNLGTANWLKTADKRTLIRDFGHDAVYKMTIFGKNAAKKFYGRPAEKSYYIGGSTGGQEGLSMAERHPEEYNGIGVFFPVTNRVDLHLRFAFERRMLHGKNYFSDAEIGKIADEIVRQNRTNPAEPKDWDRPYLKNPECATVDYSKFGFLGQEQVDILRRVHSPFADPRTGRVISRGLPPSAEESDGGKSLKKGFDCWMVKWLFNSAKVDMSKVDMPKLVDDFQKTFGGEVNALPELEAFKKAGGKLLIVQGKADTIVPAEYAKDYYKTLCGKSGGFENTASFARMFLVPGGSHSNMSADILPLVRKWVEGGIPPDKLNVSVRAKNKIFSENGELFRPEN